MSLNGALQIGRSALEVNQAALQIVGNNLANAATPGYTREIPNIAPGQAIEMNVGQFIGLGVKLEAIVRATDEALNARLRSSVSDREGAELREELLTQVETIYSELTDYGMSAHLDHFFDAWSELANNPTDTSLRALVIQQGESLAEFAQQLHRDLTDLRNQVDDQIFNNVRAANSLMDQIAALNSKIVSAERGQGGANTLRDERDELLKELSEYVDISTVLQDTGEMDVFVGSVPIVLAGVNRGLTVEYRSQDAGDTEILLRVESDGTNLQAVSGKIGQLIDSREGDVAEAIEDLDTFIGQLIFQVNRVHGQGQGTIGFSEMTAAYETDDTSQSMTLGEAGLTFTPTHGSFQLHVTQLSTGTRLATQIDVDLDGIGGPDMSIDDLVTAIDAVDNLSATTTADGRLQITADSADFTFSFSDDSSGVLAALGLNSFFTGATALDIGVNEVLDDVRFLSAAQNHDPGSNDNALAMVDLQDLALDELNGLSIRDQWARTIEDLAVTTAAAQQATTAQTVIAEALAAQRESVSGVNLDEEAINLLQYQRGYQGAARFITVIDEMMETLLTLLR